MKFLFLFLFVSLSAFSQTKIVLNVKLNPAGSFQASSESIKGNVTKKKGILTSDKITVDIKSLKTGIDLRDEHFWKHLNANKYEKASLTNLKGENGHASAKLEIAGVKLPVDINYKENGKNIMANFKVKAHDFKLPQAEYLGIGVEDEVQGEIVMPFVEL